MTKFSRVCDSIVDLIESGALLEGDRLPSEEQLAARFGVSLGTVQKALTHLAHSNLISREHGRGTFVSGPRVGAADVTYLRFRDTAGRDLPHYIHLRSVKRIKRKGPWSEFLASEGGYIRIERNMSVGKAELYCEFFLREEEFSRFDGVDRRMLQNNLRVLLGQQLSLPTLRVVQSIRFQRLPESVSRELGLQRDRPGMIIEMLGYTLRDLPLFYQRVFSGPFSENLVITR